MCFDGQWHCNAHSNNVVMLSEAEAARALAGGVREPPLCACLDFDMAFTARGFVDVSSSAARATIGADDAEFATLLERERLNFAEVLAGGDCTSGVPQVALRTVEEQPAAVHVARHLLHDTLVRGFLRAYDDDVASAEAEYDPLLHRGAYALVRMAIIVMADCLA